jgi:hypothetical protein
MPKSAERKRFGIYYTPPQFTRLIVEETLGKLIAERVESLPDLHDRVKALRKLKIVDPACGSGAFLIAAYERLEDAYEEIARQLRINQHPQDALNLLNAYPDYILSDNLYGVDLSAESVEITQLALWIRSARKGRALTDLSKNILRGNSLIRDKSVHPEAFDWRARFSEVFNREAKGFDCVIGNPPWERMKVQEREFFALAAPEIASAVNAAERRKLIEKLESENPELHGRYQTALSAAEQTLAHVRTKEAGYPLTGKGDVNTYMLFAELARQIDSPTGRIGLLVPSGIATDNTTRAYFADLVESQTLIALYDFENKRGLFEDVHRSYKFCVLLIGGARIKTADADFVFFAHSVEDLANQRRHIPLSKRDLQLINPNTLNCPVFTTREEATVVKRIYKTVPILIDHNRKSGGNPWGVKFCRMFDQTNDAEAFVSPDVLQKQGFKLVENDWVTHKERFVPLYEAKMFRPYDHRHGSVYIETKNWMNQGQTHETTLVEHQNPEFLARPRWWVDEKQVTERVSRRPCLLAFRDITRATDDRTMLAAFIPYSGVVNTAPLILFDENMSARRQCCLLGNLNALPLDFVSKRKVGHMHMNFFIVEQLPVLPPDAYDEKCPWAKSKKLEDWIAERVLKLTCTANDMRPLAEAAGFEPGVWKWKEDERAKLRAELDAAYFHLYGLSRDDVSYILGTFQGIKKEDDAHGGEGLTRRLVMQAYDDLAP